MTRNALALAAGIGLAVAGLSVAQNGGGGSESVKPLAALEIVEKVDGKETTATAVEVIFEPGQAGVPHRHPGPVLGYVIEGEFEWAIDDQPAQVLKAGDTFYEPARCLHRVSKNPGKTKTRVLAWVIHPRDAKELTILEPAKQ